MKVGDLVTYIFPVQGKKYEAHKEKPATILALYGDRVKLRVEARPNIYVQKVVMRTSIRVHDSRAQNPK